MGTLSADLTWAVTDALECHWFKRRVQYIPPKVKKFSILSRKAPLPAAVIILEQMIGPWTATVEVFVQSNG